MSTLTVTPAIDYAAPASPAQVEATIAALTARGIHVELVDTAADALARVNQLIPAEATLTTGMSQTLQQIGFEAQLINKEHPWVNLKDAILAEKDPVAQLQLRRDATQAPYYVGSVQAIAESGEIVVASGTGSQLPAYAYTSPNIIWVAGIQKIVPTLEDGLRRIREYALPAEDQRMKAMGYPGSIIGKILIIEYEPAMMGRNITLILVKEVLGV